MKMDGQHPDVENTKNEDNTKNADEPIYHETNKLHTKQAVDHFNEKYDSLGLLNEKMETLSVSSSDCTSEGTTCELRAAVSDKDLQQVELFFQSHKTSVFVCPTLASLYLYEPTNANQEAEWLLKSTGIPVVLLDKGETRARSRRRIQFVLAERGTGFVLWKDVIDNLTNYSARDDNFHTLYLSWDHRCQAGLCFDNRDAAKELLKHVEHLTSDPSNISLSGPSSKHRKQPKKRPERTPVLKKTDISQPCCFQHITRVDMGDKANYISLSTLTPEGNL